MKLSVLVVSLNAGEALLKTVNSILEQQNAEFEIIVKDGGSKDGSIERLPKNERIRVIVSEDSGIYDAMNQAAQYADGEYALYLNCGDLFYSESVLAEITQAIAADRAFTATPAIYYGDCYTVNRDYILRYPDVFDDYVCYTKVLCHQATAYPIELIKRRQFAAGYKMAADYEYYVYAYKNGYRMVHMPVVVARYEGNGASETTANRRLALTERKRAIKTHFTNKDYCKVWWKAQFRGIGLKHMLVRIHWFYPLYRKAATFFYTIKNKQ